MATNLILNLVLVFIVLIIVPFVTVCVTSKVFLVANYVQGQVECECSIVSVSYST